MRRLGNGSIHPPVRSVSAVNKRLATVPATVFVKEYGFGTPRGALRVVVYEVRAVVVSIISPGEPMQKCTNSLTPVLPFRVSSSQYGLCGHRFCPNQWFPVAVAVGAIPPVLQSTGDVARLPRARCKERIVDVHDECAHTPLQEDIG